MVKTPGGFALAEVIVVMVISSIVIASLLAALIALVRGMQPPSISVAGETLPVAPTFGAFPAAVRLHQALSDQIASARAIYVFGGRHVSLPADAPESNLLPLKAQALPVIANFSAGLPMDSKSFYDGYVASLGDQADGGAPEDFSVLIIGLADGALAVTALAQVRTRTFSVADDSTTTAYVMREVKLWESGSIEPLRYAFAEKPAQNAGIFIGAVHTWMRYRQQAGQKEEGPACAVFPDPWVYAGHRGGANDIPAFSRFSYFLAVSP